MVSFNKLTFNNVENLLDIKFKRIGPSMVTEIFSNTQRFIGNEKCEARIAWSGERIKRHSSFGIEYNDVLLICEFSIIKTKGAYSCKTYYYQAKMQYAIDNQHIIPTDEELTWLIEDAYCQFDILFSQNKTNRNISLDTLSHSIIQDALSSLKKIF